MPLFKNGQQADNHWIFLDDDAPLIAGANVVVSLNRWRAERDGLLAHDGDLGLQLEPGDDPKEISDDTDLFALITINFPIFKDGRGYSYGRLLRERYGFNGELRAIGEVLRDQILFLARCGFDSWEVSDGTGEDCVAAELNSFTPPYQPTRHSARTIVDERKGEATKAMAAE